MNNKFQALTQNVSKNLTPLAKGIPEVMQSFNALHKAANTEGALDKKTKELIALALGVAMRCDPCIGFHAKALVELGASEAEIQEMLGVAIYMGGGPSLMYASNAMAAFKEFAEAQG